MASPQASAPAAAAASSSPVRHWRRGDLIGSGSFGKVNIAINTETCELFAVKSIECSHRAHAELLALENELHILQGLDSPWIVRCLGSDYTVENSLRMRNLFMEYMAGGSLADFMKRFGGRLEEPVIRVYTRYILQGMRYLHDQGVVHCDIKGKNILIGSMGAKIADFGSAKRIFGQFAGSCKQGDTVTMKGTPLWMAPEVVQQVEQGLASDIWSLGCTIVEMATGRPPWSNKSNPFSALYQIACTEDLPPFPDCLSPVGKDFLLRCFQRDPKARWTSSQLLEHPFVSKESPSSQYMAPSSPTSILDFPEGAADWDTRSADLSSVPFLSLQEGNLTSGDGAWNDQQGCSVSNRGCISQPSEARTEGKMLAMPLPLSCPSEGNWITVRSPSSFAESRQRPLSDFMLQRPPPPYLAHLSAGGAAVEGKCEGRAPAGVKNACDLNLDCIDFLRRRWQKIEDNEGRPG